MATHSSVVAGESHGQRSLAGCSPWGHRVGHDWATNTLMIERLENTKLKVAARFFLCVEYIQNGNADVLHVK